MRFVLRLFIFPRSFLPTLMTRNELKFNSVSELLKSRFCRDEYETEITVLSKLQVHFGNENQSRNDRRINF